MTYIRAYVDTVKFHYKVAVERMCEFTRWHINPGMKEWLVRALLEVIEYDDDIDMLEKVFVIGDGLCKSKDEICNLDRYELEPFLVGVLCYILKYRCNKNGQGIDTLNYYGEKKAHKERMHKGNAGGRVERNVEVLLYEFKQGDQDVSAFEHKSILETDDTTAENEYEDKESDYGVPPESEQEDKRLMIIQHQTNVIQNGENNFNLTNNGIMNFDFGGDKK
jgi:hypothetical protein